MNGIVVSLFDYTGNMVRPWAEAGYECWCFDLQHSPSPETEKFSSGGRIYKVAEDLRKPLELTPGICIGFAFPPCTDVAVSGARWFKQKGPRKLGEALLMFATAVELFEKHECPYMIENPVSTVSTYWRKPDHTFHPHEYAGLEPSDNYTKKTCLWTGNGFVLPEPSLNTTLGKPDDRIHKAPPGPDRANFRSATPLGFARAVFRVNGKQG